jgi:hypothetical protein
MENLLKAKLKTNLVNKRKRLIERKREMKITFDKNVNSIEDNEKSDT